ncbi:DUF4124 domain-containing protein [Piscinibacter gummiphilus]|uniref:DUF4124 domain-containing protein n=1 Tax=Piscinibacter gummiphilus TaxID=946333 RepID=A0A1W6LF16_9BURK|nr:DUF4124 domain-containing protein [Piscinibacter gummiphilus]ARN22862.1 hypothetical protein A4W93_24750 [Piscinibacter gummiphilus]ATU67559.1 DUF4124 domain-containing protein [Piscinibacter gummiphilus]GLS96677.1 hypothetical protein GCM10007918_39690 [Piscinibacter gummiphilus]
MTITTRHLFATAGLVLACQGPASAQEVFKCSVGGKTVYQSAPCPGQGKSLEIKPGPSEEEVQAAKAEADARKAKLPGTVAPARAPQPMAAGHAIGKTVDCAKLNKQRGDAYGRRNAGIRGSTSPNVDRSMEVMNARDDINRIEAQMASAGCAPT